MLYAIFLVVTSPALDVPMNGSMAARISGKLYIYTVCQALGTMQRQECGIHWDAAKAVTIGQWVSPSPHTRRTGHSICERKSSSISSEWR